MRSFLFVGIFLCDQEGVGELPKLPSQFSLLLLCLFNDLNHRRHMGNQGLQQRALGQLLIGATLSFTRPCGKSSHLSGTVELPKASPLHPPDQKATPPVPQARRAATPLTALASSRTARKDHGQVTASTVHGSHPRSLNALCGSRPASCSFCHSLKNLLFSQRRLFSATHLLATSSYSPASTISRAT